MSPRHLPGEKFSGGARVPRREDPGMPLPTLLDRFARLSTLRVADGCMRAGAPVRAAPPGLRGWLREIRGSIEE